MVTIKIVTVRGHDVETLEPAVAFDFIKNEVQNKNKWLFIDGTVRMNNDFTVEDITNAEDITLANQLVGG